VANLADAGSVQGVLHACEGGVELRTDADHRGDDRNRDTRSDQAVLNGRGAGLVSENFPNKRILLLPKNLTTGSGRTVF
jgi:hypothetical protein